MYIHLFYGSYISIWAYDSPMVTTMIRSWKTRSPTAPQEADAKLKEKPSTTGGRRPSKRGAFGVGSVIFGVDGRWALWAAGLVAVLVAVFGLGGRENRITMNNIYIYTI